MGHVTLSTREGYFQFDLFIYRKIFTYELGRESHPRAELNQKTTGRPPVVLKYDPTIFG
jgi:hypothetical protein